MLPMTLSYIAVRKDRNRVDKFAPLYFLIFLIVVVSFKSGYMLDKILFTVRRLLL